jgi:hypothetical protein
MASIDQWGALAAPIATTSQIGLHSSGPGTQPQRTGVKDYTCNSSVIYTYVLSLASVSTNFLSLPQCSRRSSDAVAELRLGVFLSSSRPATFAPVLTIGKPQIHHPIRLRPLLHREQLGDGYQPEVRRTQAGHSPSVDPPPASACRRSLLFLAVNPRFGSHQRPIRGQVLCVALRPSFDIPS